MHTKVPLQGFGLISPDNLLPETTQGEDDDDCLSLDAPDLSDDECRAETK